jgi:tRNA(Ile)-lysidine synthase
MMEDLFDRFEDNLRKAGIKNGQTIILGVSGGVDSVTMLNLFLRSSFELNLIVAHLNHNVRVEADDDEKLVRILTEKLGLEFVSKKISHPKKGNLEEELRIERRNFLEQVALDSKADKIALAHNSNDQAETFILNALRGSGPAGLAGMRVSDNKIIRPLLNLSRIEIEAYGEENNLTWHEDKTNEDTKYNRNFIRHKIFPLLSQINPSFLDAINRTSYLQREIDDQLKKEAEKFITVPTDVTRLQGLSKSVLYEALGLLYEKAKGSRKDLNLQNLADLENLISQTNGTKSINLPDNITAIRRYKTLDFILKTSYNYSSGEVLEKLAMGENYFGNWLILGEKYAGLGGNSKYSLFVDENTLNKIKIKSWKPGDKMAIFGITGRKKLQDLFVDAKIDKEKRINWPIFYLGSEIIWIPKIALSRNLKPCSQVSVKLSVEEKL